jgi:hypothetical protein
MQSVQLQGNSASLLVSWLVAWHGGSKSDLHMLEPKPNASRLGYTHSVMRQPISAIRPTWACMQTIIHDRQQSDVACKQNSNNMHTCTTNTCS